jgi:hypothetical protein
MSKNLCNGHGATTHNGPQPGYDPDWELVMARSSHTTFWELI